MFVVNKLRSRKMAITGCEYYAAYEIGPFLRGQGGLVANALRRVMVNHLPDIAIVAAFIPGVKHEFDFVPGVKEDFIDLSLNLKQVRFHGVIDGPVFGRLKVQKSGGLVSAKDMELSDNAISIVNPDQYIATLSEAMNFELEFLVTRGHGYLWSDELYVIVPDGFIPIDAVFCPVLEASYSLDIGRVLDFNQAFCQDIERVILEVTTHGGLTAGQAVTWAARILQNSFTCLACDEIEYLELKDSEQLPELIEEQGHLSELYSKTKFGMLEFSRFTLKGLVLSNIFSLADLSELSIFGLETIFNVEGEKSKSGAQAVKEVAEKLEEFCGIILPQRLAIEKPRNPGNLSVSTMGFSKRALSGFERANIRTLADLMTYSVEELGNIQKMGVVSVKEVQAKLEAEFGIVLEERNNPLLPNAESPTKTKPSIRSDQIEKPGFFLGEELDIAPPSTKVD